MCIRDSLYGGSYRYFQELERQNASVFHYFEDFDSLKSQINEEITAIFLETPTNCLLYTSDAADEVGCVD
ncbi:PLP-dependent transferase, partial [Enterococcus sp. S181_ASV_20]|nr:PLP-dependent transferase [Enterococcus sp. S181_ASV_20]